MNAAFHATGNSDAVVVAAVREHLRRHHPKFTGSNPFSHVLAERRLKTATEAAAAVVGWWRSEGVDAYKSGEWDVRSVEPNARGHVARSIGSILAGWIIDLVVRLFVDWLFSDRSALFRDHAVAMR